MSWLDLCLWQGFSVEGQENIQEILSKQLMLCQFLTALSTLRTGVCLSAEISESPSQFTMTYWKTVMISVFIQVATLSVRHLTSLLPSVLVWCTCSTSALIGFPFSSLLPAGRPTLRGGAALIPNYLRSTNLFWFDSWLVTLTYCVSVIFQFLSVLYRYIVCRGLKPGSDAVREYMFRVNLKLNKLRQTDRDVTDVVPLSIIKEDPDFYQFMVNSNER